MNRIILFYLLPGYLRVIGVLCIKFKVALHLEKNTTTST